MAIFFGIFVGIYSVDALWFPQGQLFMWSPFNFIQMSRGLEFACV